MVRIDHLIKNLITLRPIIRQQDRNQRYHHFKNIQRNKTTKTRPINPLKPDP